MKKRWRWILLLLVVLGVGGAWVADRKLKGHGHQGLGTFVGQWWRNYPKSFAITPPVISIRVDEAGMEQLYAVVERARDRGVIEQEGNDFVKGDLHVDMPAGMEGSGDINVKLRIKGKMTDHVEGKKWSFRVIAKKDGGFLGMKRFSLQHPGTRNYLTDWFFHQLMKGEGIITLRYGFCQVKLNDEDLGVYAYEEHFGPELLEHNGRLAGPIVRFDPSLFWLHRTQGLDGQAKVDDAFGAYQAANLDAFSSDDIAKDPQQKKYFEQAIALMHAFRTGRVKASEVFDVERTAKRLAMLDLVGGHHSMDWSDVKFYFDPVAQKFEPISYESFSAFPTKELAGAYKATGPFLESDELHTAFFKDPVIFAAYVKHLERFSAKAWLDSAFTALKGPLDTASATLYGEFPYKELDRGIYYANQKAIRTLLSVPRALQAYAQGLRGDTLTIALQAIEGLPMQVDSLVLSNGSRVAPIHPLVLPARARGTVGRPVEIAFVGVTRMDSTLNVSCHVLGSSTRRSVDVFPFSLSVSAAQDALLAHKKPNPHEFTFLAVDEAAKTITVKPGAWRMDHTLVLPAGYRCVATGPLRLDLVNGAEIISYASLAWKGLDEAFIDVFSTDSSSHGVHVIGAVAASALSFVAFRDLTRFVEDQDRSADVSFHQSDVVMDHCLFTGNGATLLDASVCALTLTNSNFDHGSDQLETHFVQLQLKNVNFELAADDAFSAEGGVASFEGISIGGGDASGVGIKGTKGARITVVDMKLDKMEVAFEGREGAKLTIVNAEVEEVVRLAEAKKADMRYGPVRIDMKNVKVSGVKEEDTCGQGSYITLDGKNVGTAKSAKGT
jgi:CotH kinase protein